MMILKQSTAVDILIGPFLDLSDGSTAETGESPSVKLSKNGQALAAKNDVTTPVHDADGYYNCEFSTTDTNTVGTLVVAVAASANALPVRHEFQVVEEATYDALYAASATGFDANGRVDVSQWLGTAVATPTTAGVPEVDITHLGGSTQSATDLKDFADAGYNPATNKVTGVVLVDTTTTNTDMVAAAPTAASVADAVWDELQSGHVTAGTFGEMATEVAAILVDTNELQSDDVPGLIAGLNDLSAANVATELATYDGPTNTEMVAAFTEIKGATWATTDTLEAIRDRGDTAWITATTVDLNADQSGVTIGTVANQVTADVTAISGDTTAADNLELQYDTTGLTGDTFPATQAQVGNLSVGSGGISTTSNSSTTVTTGTETLTYTATAQLDGSYHEIAQAASAIEMYYEFTVGGNGVPQSVEWTGYVQTNNDNLEVYFRNWAGASWDQVGTIAGSAGTTPVSEQFIATTAHVGTGADLGKVRFRMASSGADVATVLATDRILATYTVVSQSVGYADGAVWLDTNLSNTNTESFVDGVADNPVSTIAAALTIAGNVNLKRIHSAAGSSWTMAADFSSYELMGQNYTIAFNGQTITGAQISGATVSGTFTNTNAILEDCIINAITGPGITMRRCFFNEVTITNNGTAGWFLNDCRSRVAGTGSPNFDFGAAVANTSLNLRAYSGGIELENMGGAGTDTASVEGNGQIILNANCSGGSLSYRGNFKMADNSGAVNVIATSPVIDVLDQGTAQAGSANTVTLASTASATNGQYDPGQVIILNGTGAGQARDILEYTGSTKVAVVSKDWRTNPDATSSYVVLASSGGLHVNEGLATGGAATTVTLNAAASATNDIYIGQAIFLVSGTGQDQSRIITDYVGSTKVATVHKAWQTNPSTDTGYVMLPLPSNADTTETILADVAAVKAETALIVADTNELQSDDVPGLIAALNDISVSDVLTTQMTEAYAAAGVAPTLAQSLFLIQQVLQEFGISGTTLTVNKLDQTTPAATYTLDSGTSPTSITRAT